MSTEINIRKRIDIQEEGVSITPDVSSINFIGAGVTASAVGQDVTVDITAAAGSVIYYMNQTVAQAPYQEFSSTGTAAAEQTVPATVTGGATVTIAAFQTPSGVPNTTVIPQGLWQLFLHFNATTAGQNWIIRPYVYKRDLGGTETLIFTPDPEIVTNMSTTTTMYTCDGVFPTTTLLTTDRIVVKINMENTTGVSQTVNFRTEGSQHYSVAATTLNQAVPTGGVTSVTGTAPVVSSGGTTPAISMAAASGSTNGYLSSTDWSTFNGKQNAITLTTTGTSGAATLVGSTLNVPQYAGGLTYFTEAQSTAAPNATVPVDSLTAVSAATDADAAFIPKGTGALIAAVPNNLTSGGNKRGQYAVDWQMLRNANTQVASGNRSAILGGYNNIASGTYAISFGNTSSAINDYSIAIGQTAISSGNNSISLGYANTASNTGSTALGYGNIASGAASFSAGDSNTASGSRAVAIGQSNTISGNYGVGIGNLNTATDYSTALGKSNTVSSTLSGAMGNGNTHAAGATYSFSVGRDNIISAAATNSFVAGYNNTATADRSFAIGSGNTSSGGNAIALGINATASGAQSFAALNRARATGASSFAIGGYVYVDTTASGDNSVAIGAGNTASAMFGTAVGGYGNVASGIASYANGNQANTFSIAGRQSRGYINTVSGDCQKSEFYLSVRTTGNTASTATVNGGAASTSNQVILSNQSAYRFKGTIIGKQSGSVNAAVWDIDGFIVRGANAAATTLNISNVTLVQNTPAWGTPTLAADTTNGGLRVQVTGAAATNIQWTAVIETTEVIYA